MYSYLNRIIFSGSFGLIVFLSFLLLSAALIRNDTQLQRILYSKDYGFLYEIGLLGLLGACIAYGIGTNRAQMLIKTVLALPGRGSLWLTSLYWLLVVSLYFSLFFFH